MRVRWPPLVLLICLAHCSPTDSGSFDAPPQVSEACLAAIRGRIDDAAARARRTDAAVVLELDVCEDEAWNAYTIVPPYESIGGFLSQIGVRCLDRLPSTIAMLERDHGAICLVQNMSFVGFVLVKRDVVDLSDRVWKNTLNHKTVPLMLRSSKTVLGTTYVSADR